MRKAFCVLLVLARTAHAEEHAATASYDDGNGQGRGFTITSEDEMFSLRFGARVQSFLNVLTAADETTSNFDVRRGRLQLDGNLWGKQINYRFQADWSKGNVSLKDFFGEVHVAQRAWVRFGQFKKPFSRQQITGFFRTEITDRAITDRAFNAGRDIGISIHDGYEGSPPWEWTIGVFNGTGDGAKLEGITATVDEMTGAVVVDSSEARLSNVPREVHPLVVARVGHNHGKLRGYSEADLEGGPLRWGVGLSIAAEGDLDDDGISNQRAELDYIVKVHGVSLTGGLYAQTRQVDRVRDLGASAIGAHFQSGLMLGKHWQVAFRYAEVEKLRKDPTVATDQKEIAIATNFYKHGHDAKFQGAVRLFKNGEASFSDFVLVELGANIGW